MNWISSLISALIVEVRRKLLLVVKGTVRSGVNGQSVMSMCGVADCMSVNSAASSVKMVATIVSSAAPAGTQYSEQPPEVGRSQTWGRARAAGTAGRWKLLDIAPVRVAREKATAKTIISLAIDIVFKFSQRTVPTKFNLRVMS